MRHLPLVRLALLALLGAGAAAHAQFGNPGFMTPDSAAPAPAPSAPNPSDRLFVLLLGQGGLAEVDMARLAAGNARHPHVQQFARRMLDDHGPAHQRLGEAARGAALALPEAPAPEHQTQRQQLEGLADGPAFELAYLRGQLVEHQKAAQLLLWEINAGQMAPLQQYAAATLPTVLDHLAHVQHLLAELGGAAVRELPPTARRR